MSSLNESTEFTSQNDSIPIDAAPSDTGTSVDQTSYDPYDDEEDDPFDNAEEDVGGGGDEASRSQTLNASTSHVTRQSGVTPTPTTRSPSARARARRGLAASSGGDGYTGISEEYDRTGYGSRSEATSGSFYGDYSSGYDGGGSTSYGYDDTIRSPRSGSELSSTFASFYYDNEYMVKMRRTLSFFRRPIYFSLFSLAGSGVVGGLCQAARILTRAVRLPDPTQADRAPAAGAGAVPVAPTGVPSGYPSVPDWLREVRLSLPAAVEQPVTWTLERHGVPVLSEFPPAPQSVVKDVVQNVHGAVVSWRLSAPMIPPGVFLPLFTFGALHMASRVMARRTYGDSADFDFMGSASNYNDETRDRSGITPDTRSRFSGVSNSRGVESPPQSSAVHSEGDTGANPTHNSSNYLGSTIPTGARRSLSGLGASLDSAAFGLGSPVQASAGASAPVGAVGRTDLQQRFTVALPAERDVSAERAEDEGDEDGARLRSRSRTQAPQTARHPAVGADGTTAAAGDDPAKKEKTPSGESEDVDVDAPASPGALGLSPVLADDRDSGSVSPAPATPQSAVATSQRRPLQGDVVAAVLGTPTVAAANATLVAAAQYACSAVILPNSLSPTDMVATPPSLNVEYVGDVLGRATALAQRRSLSLTAVFRTSHSAAASAAGAVPLPLHQHSQNALYIFMPETVEGTREAAEAAAVAAQSVYVSDGSARSENDMPVSECFYDRLVKERKQQQ